MDIGVSQGVASQLKARRADRARPSSMNGDQAESSGLDRFRFFQRSDVAHGADRESKFFVQKGHWKQSCMRCVEHCAIRAIARSSDIAVTQQQHG
ncbi:hypothetical protein [Cupriavidus sp. 8B]